MAAHQDLTWFGQCDLRTREKTARESTNQEGRIQEITTLISTLGWVQKRVQVQKSNKIICICEAHCALASML